MECALHAYIVFEYESDKLMIECSFLEGLFALYKKSITLYNYGINLNIIDIINLNMINIIIYIIMLNQNLYDCCQSAKSLSISLTGSK